jgi:hypothetical protein
MSLDAIVWLLAGFGLGIALSLLLLMLYSALEWLRLGRRLRRARVLSAVPATSEERGSLPRRPVAAPRTRVEPAAAPVRTAVPPARQRPFETPQAEPPAAVDPDEFQSEESIEEGPEVVAEPPASPLLADAPEASSEASVVEQPVEDLASAETPQPPEARPVDGKPEPAFATQQPSPKPAPARETAVQSVEALFAEAFALDKLQAPGPLPDPGEDPDKAG